MSTVSFTWRTALEKFGGSARAHEIAEGWQSYDCHDGVTFRLFDVRNRIAVASVITDRRANIAPYLVVILQGVVPLVYDHFWKLAISKHVEFARLSPREV